MKPRIILSWASRSTCHSYFDNPRGAASPTRGTGEWRSNESRKQRLGEKIWIIRFPLPQIEALNQDVPSRNHLTYLFAICCREGKCWERIPPVQIRYTAYPAYFQYLRFSKYGLRAATSIYRDCPNPSITECAADKWSATSGQDVVFFRKISRAHGDRTTV
jgi:hypothetical protein